MSWAGPYTVAVGLPAEALPMALLRPLSGSVAYGVMASIINDPAIGPDSYAAYLVSTNPRVQETTFYALAVYFGAVQIRRMRHALAAGSSLTSQAWPARSWRAAICFREAREEKALTRGHGENQNKDFSMVFPRLRRALGTLHGFSPSSF